MKINTANGQRSVHFPQDPPDGYQHTEYGRTWQWVKDPGMWRSVTGGVPGSGGGGPVKWDDVEEKPEGIVALGVSGLIIGGSY